jgi:hypothetical protein
MESYLGFLRKIHRISQFETRISGKYHILFHLNEFFDNNLGGEKRMKTRKNILLLAPIILTLFLLSFPFVFAADVSSTSIPGVSSDAQQFDRTDITPNGHIEQVMARTMHVFRYRYMTMLMNGSQHMVLNMTSESQVRARIFGVNVDTDQPLQLQVQMSTTPPNGIPAMQRTINTYWGLEPNATLRLRIRLRLHINSSALNGELNRAVNAEQLQWMYWNQSQKQWEAVESWIDADGYLVCETDHLSVWTVAEVTSNTLEINQLLLYGVPIIAVGVFAGILIVRQRSS